ncbi:inner membrane-spanning protein YciB [Alkalilacustris brevis]|uniref:inner membrane-spanning protein YciB n=1 Tax=Alkalilacustris brevis TaxID=2026338 RepID=UPI000E0DAD05|nr:inner membrane-spanning protein YciB [Alkalilacustris brevis]
MSETRAINPKLKMVLEMGPLLAFFLGYVWLRGETYEVGGRDYDGFIVVTALFIPLLSACTLVLWRLSGKVSRIQVTTLFMVVVFGALTVWLNDERFFKMKSTFVFGLFGLVLWVGLWRGQSYFAYVMEGLLPISPAGWMVLTRRLAWFFLLMAVANEIIWRSFSTDVYVVWDTFGQAGAMFGFFIAQSKLIEAHWIEPDTAGSAGQSGPADKH